LNYGTKKSGGKNNRFTVYLSGVNKLS